MRGLVAVVLSYGCLAIVAALLFSSGAYAAGADCNPCEGTPAPPDVVATDAPMI